MDHRLGRARRWAITAAIASGAAAGACSSPVLPPGAREPIMLTPPVAEPLDAASRILSGFDLADTPEAWSVGDRVLMSIRQTRTGGETVERLLLIELTGELDRRTMKYAAKGPGGKPYALESRFARTRLTLFDAEGARIEEAAGRFPLEMLGYGLYDGVESTAGRPPGAVSLDELDGPAFDRAMRGWLTLMSFSGSLSRRGMFQSMMKDVIARPPLLVMLLNPTVALETGEAGVTSADEWTPVTPGGERGAGLPTLRVPLVLRIAGRPGMVGEVLAGRPVAPLSLCGGLVMAEARNAERPEVRLELRLLAARRGTGGQTLTPVQDGATPE